MNILLMLWRVFRQEVRTWRDFWKGSETSQRWAEEWRNG